MADMPSDYVRTEFSPLSVHRLSDDLTMVSGSGAWKNAANDDLMPFGMTYTLRRIEQTWRIVSSHDAAPADGRLRAADRPYDAEAVTDSQGRFSFAALHEGEDRALVHWATATATIAFGWIANLVSRAVVRLICLHDAARAAHRGKAPFAHRFTNAVAHEPRRLIRDIEGAVQLMGGHALLAAGHQVKRL